ncbi:MAG: hypothetical protein MUO62_10590, partial [Anaerolineales bacterium]|nr:hypothetical protein [Anaerolineales bacterium]
MNRNRRPERCLNGPGGRQCGLLAGSVPENFIGLIIKRAPQNIIIIDAVDFSASAGSINLFSPQQAESFSI